MYQTAAILGLSTFCKRVARGLEENRISVLAIDYDQTRVNEMSTELTRVLCGDLRNKDILVEAGVADCEMVIVGLPDHFDIEVLLVHLLSEMGVPEIIVQVNSEDQAAAITKVGATRSVFPEQLAAQQMVRQITLPGLLEHMGVGDNAALVEVICPAQFEGKTLAEINLRQKYEVHVVGLTHNIQGKKQETVIAPTASEVFAQEDRLTVLGKVEKVREFVQNMEQLNKEAKSEQQKI